MKLRIHRSFLFTLFVAILLLAAATSSQVEEEQGQQSTTTTTTTDTSDTTAECSPDDQQCKNPMMADNDADDDTENNKNENDSNKKDDENNDSTTGEQQQKEKIRMITHEELQVNVGEKDGDPIWLSVLGEVYDVTAGKDFYGPKTSYGGLSGTDCSLCFVSGIFTKEEGAKDTSEIETNVLPGILDWRNFYAGYVSSTKIV